MVGGLLLLAKVCVLVGAILVLTTWQRPFVRPLCILYLAPGSGLSDCHVAGVHVPGPGR